jgi:hypothetical protein
VTMKCKIEITMDNAAFEEDAGMELARILRRLATDAEKHSVHNLDWLSLRDMNGNYVGRVTIEEKE